MTSARTIAMLLALCGFVLAWPLGTALALDPAGFARPSSLVEPAQIAVEPSQKDCQTIVSCNFRRGGSYRGCISAYSCRSCRFIRARCRIVDGRRVCEHQSRCHWGSS